jgi:hypothetical protein
VTSRHVGDVAAVQALLRRWLPVARRRTDRGFADIPGCTWYAGRGVDGRQRHHSQHHRQLRPQEHANGQLALLL